MRRVLVAILGWALVAGAGAQPGSWLGGAADPPPAVRRPPPVAPRPPRRPPPPPVPEDQPPPGGEEAGSAYTPTQPVACGTRLATPLDRISETRGHRYSSFTARSAVWLRGAVLLGDRDAERGALFLSPRHGGRMEDGALYPVAFPPLWGSKELRRVRVAGEDLVLTQRLALYGLREGGGLPRLEVIRAFQSPESPRTWHLCGVGLSGDPERAVVLHRDRVAVLDLAGGPVRSASLPFVAERGVLIPGPLGGELYLSERRREPGQERRTWVHRVLLQDQGTGVPRLEVAEHLVLPAESWVPHLVTIDGAAYLGSQRRAEGVTRGAVWRIERRRGRLALGNRQWGNDRLLVADADRLVAGGLVYRIGSAGRLLEHERLRPGGPRTMDGFPYFGDLAGDRLVVPEGGTGDDAGRVHCLE